MQVSKFITFLKRFYIEAVFELLLPWQIVQTLTNAAFSFIWSGLTLFGKGPVTGTLKNGWNYVDADNFLPPQFLLSWRAYDKHYPKRHLQIYHYSGPEVIKLFSYSTQLGMKFSLLLNMKMPKIVGIFIFISREIFILSYV